MGLKCSHFGFPLDKGELFGDRVICPLHLASFNVKTGTHELGPVFKGLPSYPVNVRDSKVYTRVPEKITSHSRVLEPEKRDKMTNKHFVIVGGGPAG